MHLTYVDDSGSDKKAPRVVIGAAVIRHEFIQEIEAVAGAVVEKIIPTDRLDRFEEFHACQLFGGGGIFRGIHRTDRINAMTTLLHQVPRFDIPFIYSAIDKGKLSTRASAAPNPIEIAFRMCTLGIQRWLTTHDEHGLALLICDDTTERALKNQLRRSFRALRPRLLPPTWPLGRVTQLHDEMYFGHSKDSIGLQIADACTWLIHRSLEQDDVPDLYEEIATQVICSKVEPDWTDNRNILLEYNPNVANIP